MLTAILYSLCIIEIALGGSGTGILMVAVFIAIFFHPKRKSNYLNSTVALAITEGFVVLRL